MDYVTRQFLQMRPMRSFHWPDAAAWAEEDQLKVLHCTVSHPLATAFPPSPAYHAQFLKSMIAMVERSGQACDDHLMDLYMKYYLPSDQPEDGMAACFRSYQLLSDGLPWVTLREEIVAIRSGTTGLRTWQAAFGLAQYLCDNQNSVKGKAVLELGAGVGFSGLCCTQLGAKSVHFTDMNDEVLSRLKGNIQLNMKTGGKEDITPHKVSMLDWETISDDELTEITDSTDVVIASDITYDPVVFGSLASVLSRLLRAKPDTRGLIAATIRSQDTYSQFLAALASAGISHVEHPVAKDHRSFFYEETADIVVLSLGILKS
ncbi:hypothetical protein HDU67_009572 [Dinochytrium kinnereticum]|nr:hypothetical protein HDU67_009572 [Dinochytrium kinnereticum]